MVFKRIGRKLVQGAKAEIQENPELFNPDKVLNIVEAGISLIMLGLTVFTCSKCGKTKPTVLTMTVNNYYFNK